MKKAPRGREVRKAVLDLFSTLTDLPVGLYEPRGDRGDGVMTECSLTSYEPHCRYLHQFPGAKDLCDADQCNRALAGLHEGQDRLTLCHAGMYNQVSPIVVRGKARAALLYGEMQVSGEEYRERALERHRQTVVRLGLDEGQAEELRRRLLGSKTYDPEKLDRLKAAIATVERLLLEFIDGEEETGENYQRALHDVQTRLQSHMSHIASLIRAYPKLGADQVQVRLEQILGSARALSTVTQTLGENLEEYRFRLEPIVDLVSEAKWIYDAEAQRRGIEITAKLQHAQIEVSRSHLQYALNNLMHNAVKYSFASAPERHRFVRITGQLEGDCYKLSFENYGVGILPEEIQGDVVFQEGYRGKLTDGEYRTGSGKGLHFAWRVIARHRGRIEVESTLKTDHDSPQGDMLDGLPHLPHLNRFTVYLPRTQPAEEAHHGKDHRVDRR